MVQLALSTEPPLVLTDKEGIPVLRPGQLADDAIRKAREQRVARAWPSPRGDAALATEATRLAQEKAKQLASNRENVERRYRSKFANANESQLWETVPLRRWYG